MTYRRWTTTLNELLSPIPSSSPGSVIIDPEPRLYESYDHTPVCPSKLLNLPDGPVELEKIKETLEWFSDQSQTGEGLIFATQPLFKSISWDLKGYRLNIWFEDEENKVPTKDGYTHINYHVSPRNFNELARYVCDLYCRKFH